MLLETLRADSLLSFAPGAPAIALHPLNVIIGPNGSGKSNLLEAIELLRATPTDFASAIRDGGGVREWLWKGDGGAQATLEPGSYAQDRELSATSWGSPRPAHARRSSTKSSRRRTITATPHPSSARCSAASFPAFSA